jgi:23S rRNA pseudouridine2604 synthase
LNQRHQLRYLLTRLLRCSYAQADQFCHSGLVFIDTKVATEPRLIVHENQEILVDKQIIRPRLSFRYLLFHKPSGYECTANPLVENTIYKLLPASFADLFPLGRLDKNSEGLLLLTNDGKTYRMLMNKTVEFEKEYLVRTKNPINKALEEAFTKPMLLGQRFTKPAKFEQLDEFNFKVILTEGINRQIRRICAKSENQVLQLTKIRFGQQVLGNLPVGEWIEVEGF